MTTSLVQNVVLRVKLTKLKFRNIVTLNIFNRKMKMDFGISNEITHTLSYFTLGFIKN